MTCMNVELAYELMHGVDIGTYLKADAAQLFLKCLQPSLPKAVIEHARSSKSDTYLKHGRKQGTDARELVEVSRGLGQAVGYQDRLFCAVKHARS